MEIILLAVFAFVLGCVLTAVVLVPRFDKNSMNDSRKRSEAVLNYGPLLRENAMLDSGHYRPIEPFATGTFLDPRQFQVSQVKLDDK